MKVEDLLHDPHLLLDRSDDEDLVQREQCEHGGERVRLTHFRLEDLIKEYRLLRQVLFEVLEEQGRLSTEERRTLDVSLDETIAEACTGYALVQSSFRDQLFAIVAHDLRTPLGAAQASAALILGAVVAHLAHPSGTSYGSGLFPAVLASQVLTAVVGVALWRRRWQARGFYPTFVPVVSVAPATVLTFDGTTHAVLAGALAGALIAPPVAAAISARLPAHVHPFTGNVASMSLCTGLTVAVLRLMPGFAS